LNFVAPLAGDPDDVSEAQRRRQHDRRLRRGVGRPARGRHRQEKNKWQTRETVHGVTLCWMRVPQTFLVVLWTDAGAGLAAGCGAGI
jgi:hypothetical protein